MGDKNCAQETLSLPPSISPSRPPFTCSWACGRATFVRKDLGEMVRRDLITEVFCPVANWAALGTWLLIASFFSIWTELSLLFVQRTPTRPFPFPTPPSPFEFPPYGKGRIVCRVTLWMCNARPRAVLALLVLIAVSHWGLNLFFCIVYSRGLFLF